MKGKSRMKILLVTIWLPCALVLGAILGHIYQSGWHQPVKESDNQSKQQKTHYYLDLEDHFQKQAERSLFIASVRSGDYTGTAFAVNFRSRFFILTASHIMDERRIYHRLSLRGRNDTLALEDEFTVSLMNDIAAYEVPQETLSMLGIQSAPLYFAVDDLIKKKTPLAIMCNPWDSLVYPIRIGFFTDYTGVNDSDNMEIRFPGLVGVVRGCSGGPVSDSEDRIRGLVVGDRPQNRNVVFVPSRSIQAFLLHKFFNEEKTLPEGAS